MPWIAKAFLLCVGTLTAGLIPPLAIMWANYKFDPAVCWTDAYGAWVIVPMLAVGCIWGALALGYLESRLKICDHERHPTMGSL